MDQQTIIGWVPASWGAFDHASRAPKLRSCSYNIHARMLIFVAYLLDH